MADSQSGNNSSSLAKTHNKDSDQHNWVVLKIENVYVLRCPLFRVKLQTEETVLFLENVIILDNALGHTDYGCHFFKRYIAGLKIFSKFLCGHL